MHKRAPSLAQTRSFKREATRLHRQVTLRFKFDWLSIDVVRTFQGYEQMNNQKMSFRSYKRASRGAEWCYAQVRHEYTRKYTLLALRVNSSNLHFSIASHSSLSDGLLGRFNGLIELFRPLFDNCKLLRQSSFECRKWVESFLHLTVRLVQHSVYVHSQ